MSSTTTYKKITPTYLYIKQHSISGLKYFGKTTKKDPVKYLGSGTYWTDHYKKHGKEHIKTLWVSDLYYDTSIVEIALHFSYENKIDSSPKVWANLKPENGLDGGNITTEIIQKIKDTKIRNGTTNNNTPQSIQKSLDAKLRNGTLNPTLETIQKSKDTKKERGVENPMKNPENVQKMLDTKLQKYGTLNLTTVESIQRGLNTKKDRGIESPSKIPFLSMIHNRKTYARCHILRWFPELKIYLI